MEHLAPLLQTLLWVVLIAGALLRFHQPIYGVLNALQRRIEGGSSIKAGPFELTDQLKPQDLTEVKEKADVEVREAVNVENEVESQSLEIQETTSSTATVRERYFQAEDLALRAIQAEYGVTIGRQLTLEGRQVDGVFVLNERLNVVEIKYVPSRAMFVSRYKSTIDRLTTAISQSKWGTGQIILAVVFELSSEIEVGSERLQKVAAGNSVPVLVRCYSAQELRLRFGVAEI